MNFNFRKTKEKKQMTISANGQATLAAMAATGTAYLTRETGEELLNLSLINIDVNSTDPSDTSAFLCTLTQAGRTTLLAGVAPVVPVASLAPVAPVGGIEIESNIALPTIKRGGSGSGSGSGRGPSVEKFPFSQLEVGQSFHISPGDDLGKTSRIVSTHTSKANRASDVPVQPPQLTLATKKRAKKDADGNNVVNADGVKIFETYNVEEQAMVQTKFFVTRKVPATDPKGVGIRVFRVSE